MNWLEMFAIFVISLLGYLIVTSFFGGIIVDAVEDCDAFPWGAWATVALMFIVVIVVVLALAYGLPFPLKR